MVLTSEGASSAAPPDNLSRTLSHSRVHPVVAYIARRLAAGLMTLFVASILIFAAVNVLPGDVASIILGRSAPPEAMESLRNELNLNAGLLSQYGQWISGVVRGDFGNSAVSFVQTGSQISVWSQIEEPFENTLILAGITIVLLIPLSLMMGVVAGVWASKPADYAISMPALLLGSVPEFVLGTGLVFVFFSTLDLLPPVAVLTPGQSPLTTPEALVLPVLTLLGTAIAFSTSDSRRYDRSVASELRGDGADQWCSQASGPFAFRPEERASAERANLRPDYSVPLGRDHHRRELLRVFRHRYHARERCLGPRRRSGGSGGRHPGRAVHLDQYRRGRDRVAVSPEASYGNLMTVRESLRQRARPRFLRTGPGASVPRSSSS